MTCSYFKVGGHAVIACGRDRIHACTVCGEIAGYLCDWKVDRGTCDVPMCETHRHNVSKNRDLCWRHMNAWRTHPANTQQQLAL